MTKFAQEQQVFERAVSVELLVHYRKYRRKSPLIWRGLGRPPVTGWLLSSVFMLLLIKDNGTYLERPGEVYQSHRQERPIVLL